MAAENEPTEGAVAAGLDGCRAGWIGALAFGDTARPQRTALCLFESIGEVLSWRGQQAAKPVVAIDVPIGLPQAVGLRECDREARARLGSRWMSVFEPPDRELFDHDFESARAVVCARRARDPRATFHVLTQQGAHILSKVAEVDEALREEPTRQDWLVEVHPEVSFREQAGEDLPRKKSGAGKARRREFLREQFPDIDVWLKPGRWPRREVGVDDLLDAYIALWSALRFARGNYDELGKRERDECGLLMRMIV